MQKINDSFIDALAGNVEVKECYSDLSSSAVQMLHKVVKGVAGQIIVPADKDDLMHSLLNDSDWVALNSKNTPCFFTYPVHQADNLYVIVNPIAEKCCDEPEKENFVASNKALGVISSMVALSVIEYRLLKEVDRDKGKPKGYFRDVFSSKDTGIVQDLEKLTKLMSAARKAIDESFKRLLDNKNLSADERVDIEASYNTVFLCIDNMT